MTFLRLVVALILIIGIQLPAVTVAKPLKIAIVSSYHPEYLWSGETNEGVLKALYEYNFLTDVSQGDSFTRDHFLKNDKVVLKKWWMNSKHKNSLQEMHRELSRIIEDLQLFAPDIVLTGDDNATNYIGNHYIDSETPLIFWGINGNPMKYGLLDSLEKPGRNISGVYQAGYLKECIIFLKSLVPNIRTIAVLSDDSVSSRAKLKKLKRLNNTGELPVKIVSYISTNNYREWQQQAMDAAMYADAFFVLNHSTLKDDKGNPVNELKAGAWYLTNIKKPEISHERHFIVEGMLAAVSDSGLKQGYLAMSMAIRTLRGENPGAMPVVSPKRGEYVVNKERALALNLYEEIKRNEQIEAWIEESLALKQYPSK